MKKPNSAQIALLIAGISGIGISYFILKAKSRSTPTASGSATTSFTGGYSTYNSFSGGNGSSVHADMCDKLMEALHYVQVALTHSSSMTPAQITSFKNQEMQLLAQLQKNGCHSNNGQ